MMMRKQLALSDAAEWLGDWHPLAEQLGSADGLLELGSVSSQLRLGPVNSLAALRRFLRHYQSKILLPLELPVIRTAYSHALRHEARELVALDCQLAEGPMLATLAGASRRVGRGQLQKLRPLRDERLVQRYLHAVESGEAHGWHVLVYGMTLAVYSLPLRQGLLGYAHQCLRGFIYSAARALRLSERECRRLFDELGADLPAGVDLILR
jgi:urease accessory protein UreF